MKQVRTIFFAGAAVCAAVFFAGCDAERLQAENEMLKKEIRGMEDKTREFQSEFNRLTAERDEQRKLRRDLEIENKKLKFRVKRLEGE